MFSTSPKILVIEDNPDNQQLISWILEDAHYRVICANSAEEGLELLEVDKFDLVLMDISLPGMDGKQATQKIRNSPHLAKLPVIALSAHSSESEIQKILESGVDDMLSKPVDETTLLEKLRHLPGK